MQLSFFKKKNKKKTTVGHYVWCWRHNMRSVISYKYPSLKSKKGDKDQESIQSM